MIYNLQLRGPRRIALVTFERAHLDLYEFDLFLTSPVLILAAGPPTALLGGFKDRLLSGWFAYHFLQLSDVPSEVGVPDSPEKVELILHDPAKVDFRVTLQVVEQLPQTHRAQVEGLQVRLLDQVRPIHQALEVVTVCDVEDVAELMRRGLQGTVELQIQLLVFAHRSVRR
jgi:hypothetical protein